MSSRPPLHGLKTQSGLIATISIYKSFLDFDAIILRFCAGAVARTGRIPPFKTHLTPCTRRRVKTLGSLSSSTGQSDEQSFYLQE